MQWHRHDNRSWFLLLPGLLGLFILAGLFLFLLGSLRMPSPGTTLGTLNNTPAPAESLLTPRSVFDQYQNSLQALVASIASGALDKNGIFASVDTTMFQVRVPQPLLDAHLKAVLAIHALEQNQALTDKDVATKVTKILQSLITAATNQG